MKPKKPIETLLWNVRSQKVILDADLAELYCVPFRQNRLPSKSDSISKKTPCPIAQGESVADCGGVW